MRLALSPKLLGQTPYASPADGRLQMIDLARGLAVTLMILSHGVKGLLDFDQFTAWGLVPVHAITKFSSSLFIIVFGMALAVAFVPLVRTDRWPKRRARLWLAALLLLFWYKVLTVVELFSIAEPELILDTLLYRSFPSFVEILGFYAIALLWVPLFLSLWVRMPLWLRLASPVILAAVGQWLAAGFDFWGSVPVRALLVEHPELYTWGQLTRGPLILLGLLIGELVLYCHSVRSRRLLLAVALAGVALLLFAVFFVLAGQGWYDSLQAIAMNQGKHPPERMFMIFSLAGSFAILALVMAGGELLPRLLAPITVIGSDARMAFIFHISVIFVVFRYLLGYWQSVDYMFALTLTIGLILGTAVWIKLTAWVRKVS